MATSTILLAAPPNSPISSHIRQECNKHQPIGGEDLKFTVVKKTPQGLELQRKTKVML